LPTETKQGQMANKIRNEKKLNNSEQGEEIRPSLNPIIMKTADGVTIDVAKDNRKKVDLQSENVTFSNALKESPKPGMYKKQKNMKQVNKFGEAFPMIQPNPNMVEPQANRAARSAESNQLQNNPNPMQDMSKFPASRFGRDMQFNQIASSAGTPNQAEAPQSTETGFNTPQQSTFPGSGGMAKTETTGGNYVNPKRIINTESKTLQAGADNMVAASADLAKAFAETTDSEFASKGERKQKRTDRKNKRALKTAMNSDDLSTDSTQSMGNLGMYDGPSKALVGGQGNLPEHLQKAILDAPGMYSYPNKDHAHTKVTASNYGATKRDDQAHMDYLKRDIKYDNKHGGSDKRMTADEKHITKLAKDLKYDNKHHGRKYDNV
jgi:hypothetical protein